MILLPLSGNSYLDTSEKPTPQDLEELINEVKGYKDSTMKKIFKLHHLSKCYNVTIVLDDINLGHFVTL